ncbi:MAG: hypothetical protein QM736_06530 [Vicinamibacterales bacterium]
MAVLVRQSHVTMLADGSRRTPFASVPSPNGKPTLAIVAIVSRSSAGRGCARSAAFNSDAKTRLPASANQYSGYDPNLIGDQNRALLRFVEHHEAKRALKASEGCRTVALIQRRDDIGGV